MLKIKFQSTTDKAIIFEVERLIDEGADDFETVLLGQAPLGDNDKLLEAQVDALAKAKALFDEGDDEEDDDSKDEDDDSADGDDVEDDEDDSDDDEEDEDEKSDEDDEDADDEDDSEDDDDEDADEEDGDEEEEDDSPDAKKGLKKMFKSRGSKLKRQKRR